MKPTVNSMGRHYDEKRNFIRMQINAEATIIHSNGHTSHGHCHNLSGGGALLALASSEEVNNELEVTIHSPHGHSPVFSAKGRVVRCLKDTAKECYSVAVAYDQP